MTKSEARRVSRQIPKYTLVRLTWRDSNYVRGWRHHDEVTMDCPPIITVGYVVEMDEKTIEIANTVGLDGAKLNALSLPLGIISKIELAQKGAFKDQDVLHR